MPLLQTNSINEMKSFGRIIFFMQRLLLTNQSTRSQIVDSKPSPHALISISLLFGNCSVREMLTSIAFRKLSMNYND